MPFITRRFLRVYRFISSAFSSVFLLPICISRPFCPSLRRLYAGTSSAHAMRRSGLASMACCRICLPISSVAGRDTEPHPRSVPISVSGHRLEPVAGMAVLSCRAPFFLLRRFSGGGVVMSLVAVAGFFAYNARLARRFRGDEFSARRRALFRRRYRDAFRHSEKIAAPRPPIR